MAVPRNRNSNARKNSKRAHHAKTPKQFQACIHCGSDCMPHRACPKCRSYGGQPATVAAE